MRQPPEGLSASASSRSSRSPILSSFMVCPLSRSGYEKPDRRDQTHGEKCCTVIREIDQLHRTFASKELTMSNGGQEKPGKVVPGRPHSHAEASPTTTTHRVLKYQFSSPHNQVLLVYRASVFPNPHPRIYEPLPWRMHPVPCKYQMAPNLV